MFWCCCTENYAVNEKVMMLPNEDESCCWICLEPSNEKGDIKRICKCNTLVHERCIKKWQLVKKGTFEEHSCRFCKEKLDTLPTPRKVNVFFKDCYLGDVTINYTYEYFKQSLQNIIRRYNFDNVITVEFVCRKGVNQVDMTTGVNAYESAQSYDVLFVRILLPDTNT